MSPTTLPACTPASHVLHRTVGDETVLVHLGSETVFSLNDTASRWWQLMAAGRGPSEIRQRLLEEFEVEGSRLDRELQSLVTALTEQGLVVPAG